MTRKSVRLVPLLAVLPLVLTACGAGGTDATSDGDSLDVQASFYPLAYAVEQVGGDHVEVTNLTGAGVDPHEVELSPADVGAVQNADLVVYSEGLGAAVDEAVESQAADHALDVNEFATLGVEHPESIGEADEEGHDHEGEHDEGHSDEGHDHGAGAVDTHFWLDPIRYGDVARAIADKLAERDPDNAGDYQAGADDFIERLDQLDGDFESGLASCTRTEMVTGHSAFAYLADRYGFTQVGITGLSPDSEPTPGRLADVTEYVQEHQVRTLYTGTLLDPAVAETIARETGADTAVLDPLEGLTEASPGEDYFEVMRANLETLRIGQDCS